MRHASLILLATVLGAPALAGCTDSTLSERGTSVVTAFYPYAAIAERVAGAHASVSNLTAPGAEAHDLELTPQQVAQVTAADVVVYQAGFQPAVDDAVQEYAEGRTIEVTKVAQPTAGAADPHLWLDPTNLTGVARSISDTLAAVDADHAQAYRAHARAVVDDLEALDQEFRSGLAHCRRKTIVTSHAAFGHLARRYGLDMVSIAGLTPDAEPSPARLAELRDVVTDSGVSTIFSETLASPALAKTLAAEAGVRTAVLDPIEGLSEATADEDYFSLMRSNLATLRRANDCR